MPVDPKRLQSVFLAALEASDRAAFLDRECAGDAELRQRVEKLLVAHDDDDELPAAPDRTCAYESIAEQVGTKIGPFVLREQIGEGGFGLVFVAEQTEPVKRKVALKVIKPGMDTREVISRFEAERQALALMDHPNIARVLDAGATDSGRPYFVMELVRGIPITEYCDKNQLPPKERLDLFVTVCQAIQHAHQKGIIHRDVKPSNVLVTSHDGKPVAKVIDFGVAKAINQQLSERSIYTNFAQMIGTPLYMSPEQAEISGLDIDTRSDIYSLGVLLYELLTGTTPLDRKKFAKAAYDEIRRLIREEEPPKPSTRVSTSDSIASVAAQRRTEPAKLSRLMRGDLDWITMKCLEKDRTRRYETANGLARDIQRYLSDEPVEACPPSTTYRLRKFARKNRAALTTAATIALLLVGGIAVSTWQAVRATHAERAARDAQRAEAERADGEHRAKQEALDAKAKAEKAEASTLASYRASTDEAIEDLIGSKPQLGPQERTYLEKTAKRWQAFADRTGVDEKARAIRGEGHDRVGSLWLWLGRPEEAQGELRQALAVREKLATDFPANPAYRQDVARSRENLGWALLNVNDNRVGEQSEAAEQHRRALAIREKLATEFPAVPVYRQELAHSHRSLWATLWKGPESGEHGRQALAIQEKLVAEFPTVPAYRQELALTHFDQAGQLSSLPEKRAEAEGQYRQALAIREKLVADFPAVAAYRANLALDICEYARAFRENGRPVERLAWFEKAIGALTPVYEQDRQLAGDEVGRAYLDASGTRLAAYAMQVGRQSLQDSYLGRAEAHDDLREYAEAVKDWDRAIELSGGNYTLEARRAQ